MAELTIVRRDVEDMRAIKSELKEARTELLLARLNLKEVSDRLGGGSSYVGVTSGGKHINRKLLRGIGGRDEVKEGGKGGGGERVGDIFVSEQ